MSAHRSSIKGAASFRRLLRNIGPSANTRLVKFLTDAGPLVAAEMKAIVPVLQTPRPDRVPGAGRDSIGWRVTPKSLNLKVGTLNAKLGRSKFFYLHILDIGRRGGNVKVTRGSKNYPNGINVRTMTGRRILSKVRRRFRWEALPGFRTIMNDILANAARGIGND